MAAGSRAPTVSLGTSLDDDILCPGSLSNASLAGDDLHDKQVDALLAKPSGKGRGRGGRRGPGRGRGAAGAAAAESADQDAKRGRDDDNDEDAHPKKLGKKGTRHADVVDPRKTTGERVGVCNTFCESEKKVLAAKQKSCYDCYTDLAAMRRDAKIAGKEAAAHLKALEKPGREAELKALHLDWKVVVGPCNGGTSRIGLFDWAQVLTSYYASSGKRRSEAEVMKTETEFIDIFEKKGERLFIPRG